MIFTPMSRLDPEVMMRQIEAALRASIFTPMSRLDPVLQRRQICAAIISAGGDVPFIYDTHLDPEILLRQVDTEIAGLGGGVVSNAVAFASGIGAAAATVINAIVSDDFNRADGGLGSNWATYGVAGSSPVISGNKVQNSTSGRHEGGYWNPAVNTFADDQFSQITIRGAPYLFVVVRQQNTPGVANSYGVEVDIGISAAIKTHIITGAGPTIIGATITAAVSPGDVIRVRAVGTSIITSVNGVDVLTTVDSTYTGGSPGFDMYSPSPGDVSIDNWSGGPII